MMSSSFFAAALLVAVVSATSTCSSTCPTGYICSNGACANNTFAVPTIYPALGSYTIASRSSPFAVITLDTTGGRPSEGTQPAAACYVTYSYVSTFGGDWDTKTAVLSWTGATSSDAGSVTDSWTTKINLTSANSKLEATAYCVLSSATSTKIYVNGATVGKNIRYQLEVLPTIVSMADKDGKLGHITNVSAYTRLNVLVTASPIQGVAGTRPVPGLSCYTHYGTVTQFGGNWTNTQDQGMEWWSAYSNTTDVWTTVLFLDTNQKMEATVYCNVLTSSQGNVWLSKYVNYMLQRFNN